MRLWLQLILLIVTVAVMVWIFRQVKPPPVDPFSQEVPSGVTE